MDFVYPPQPRRSEEKPMSEPRSDFPLEPGSGELRSLLEQATDYVLRHLDSISKYPSPPTAESERVAAALREDRAPDRPHEFTELLKRLW